MRSLFEKSALCAMGALVAACGAAPAPVEAPAADHPAVEVVTSSPPWQRYAEPIAGFSVAMPGVPRRDHEILSERAAGEMRTLRYSDGDPRTMDFEATRFAPSGVTYGVDAERFADRVFMRSKGAHKDRHVRQGREAIEVTGDNETGRFVVSIVAAGPWLYLMSVHAKGGVDMASAERFFDSLRIEMPWRIEAFPAEGLTLALPAPAAARSTPSSPPGTKIVVYQVDWDTNLWIGVSLFTLDAERLRTATHEEILDDGVKRLTAIAGVKVTSVASFEHHGMVGREVTHTMSGGQAFRSRVFAVGRRGYHISVSATDAALLTKDTATQILDSIRIDSTAAH